LIFPYHARHGSGRTGDLEKAYGEEKDPRVKIRMAAADTACVNNEGAQRLAHAAPQSGLRAYGMLPEKTT